MEPISISALATLLATAATGAATDVGRSAWTTVANLAGRAFGREHPGTSALDELAAGNGESAPELAGYLVQHAASDPDFHTRLRDWMAAAENKSTGPANEVTNSIHRANVRGSVFQSGNITGDVNIGRGD